MTAVRSERRLALPAVDVWERIGGFADVAAWHPGVRETRLEDSGRLRCNRLGDGRKSAERLLDRDNAQRRYSYELVEAPLPVATSVGTLRVDDDGSGDGSIVRWSIELQ